MSQFNAGVVVQAIYDFAAEEDDEVAFKAGDLLTIAENSAGTGWMRASNNSTGETGLLPEAYVVVAEGVISGSGDGTPASNRNISVYNLDFDFAEDWQRGGMMSPTNDEVDDSEIDEGAAALQRALAGMSNAPANGSSVGGGPLQSTGSVASTNGGYYAPPPGPESTGTRVGDPMSYNSSASSLPPYSQGSAYGGGGGSGGGPPPTNPAYQTWDRSGGAQRGGDVGGDDGLYGEDEEFASIGAEVYSLPPAAAAYESEYKSSYFSFVATPPLGGFVAPSPMVFEERDDPTATVLVGVAPGNTGTGSSTIYVVNYSSPNATSSVLRKYKDFSALHQSLVKRYIYRIIPSLPSKGFKDRFSGDDFVYKRESRLNGYLNALVRSPALSKDSMVNAFMFERDDGTWEAYKKADKANRPEHEVHKYAFSANQFLNLPDGVTQQIDNIAQQAKPFQAFVAAMATFFEKRMKYLQNDVVDLTNACAAVVILPGGQTKQTTPEVMAKVNEMAMWADKTSIECAKQSVLVKQRVYSAAAVIRTAAAVVTSFGQIIARTAKLRKALRSAFNKVQSAKMKMNFPALQKAEANFASLELVYFFACYCIIQEGAHFANEQLIFYEMIMDEVLLSRNELSELAPGIWDQAAFSTGPPTTAGSTAGSAYEGGSSGLCGFTVYGKHVELPSMMMTKYVRERR